MGDQYVITSRRRALRAILASVLAGMAILLAPGASAASAAPEQEGQWGPLMDFAVSGTHMALMHTGKVLYWRDGDTARVWDPATGGIDFTPSPFPIPGVNFHCAGQVVLADGRVLVVGGQVGDSTTSSASAATFDPLSHTWTRVADMTMARWYPTATVLGDGRVLVTTGRNDNDDRVTTSEVYDPSADRWRVLRGADREADYYAPVYVLPDGRAYNAAPGATTAFLDSGLQTWSDGPAPLWRTIGYSESGAMYEPGKIIRSGGTTEELAATTGATNRTAIIDATDPAAQWRETSPMAFARRRHNMVILADGSVLAVGGTRQGDDPAQAVLEPEVFNPAAETWRTVAAIGQARMYHSSAVLLPDGRVLSAGGDAGHEARTAQVYSPPYLFTGSRPVMADAPAEIAYGGAFAVSTAQAADIASVALIRPSAVTHASDMDQRYVPLAFAREAGGLTVAEPQSGNVAPPGWYMLVIRDSRGAPSMATWTHLGADNASALPVPGMLTTPAPPPVVPAAPAAGPPRTPGGTPTSHSAAFAAPPAARPAPATGDARVAALNIRRRVSLREVRVRGLRVSVVLTGWQDARPRTVRIRLFERRNNRRRLVATVFRSLTRPAALRLALRSVELRRLLAGGLHEVEVAAGTSRRKLRPGGTRFFRITR